MSIDPKLWESVERQFPMGRNSHHGPEHWRRVFLFGKRLAQATGADLELIELFAVFHDSRRMNDSIDPDHGKRGADLALRYHGELFNLDQERLDILLRACRDHTDGSITSDPIIGTCWDADRLDLWRVGIYPHVRFLCTDEAKKIEVITWAVRHTAPDQPTP